ncbi:MAG: hypothetical protein RLZZ350_2612 [Verrucomicrobiota bacterium]|jgi:tetratricopeptide (TPR) repeat protein
MADKKFDEILPALKPLFRKGTEAAQRDNFDYAIELFNQVLDKEPGCAEVRAALRAAQIGKAGKAGGFFKKAFNLAGSSPQLTKAKLALNHNPLEAMQITEQIFNSDPHNSTAHRIFADAALAAGMPFTAVLSLEALAKTSPGDKAVVSQLAQALADTGEVARAEQIMANLCRANPHDPNLSALLKNISATRTLDEGGYDEVAATGGSYRELLKDKEEAVVLEQENRAQKNEDTAARLITEYETRLTNEPNNLKLVRNLAELHTQKQEFDRALEYYQQLKSAEMGGDPSLDRAIAETVARKFDFTAAQINPFAADHAEQVARLNADKQAWQISECQQRVEKYPTDLAIRFELGALYFAAGKIGEAISEFQKAQGNPHKRLAAMNYLAQCFSARKMFDLAARTLQNALKEKLVFDEEKKELTYQLGCVLEKMGKREEAMEQFKVIYEADIGYKDVSAKVDAYYAAQ